MSFTPEQHEAIRKAVHITLGCTVNGGSSPCTCHGLNICGEFAALLVAAKIVNGPGEASAVETSRASLSSTSPAPAPLLVGFPDEFARKIGSILAPGDERDRSPAPARSTPDGARESFGELVAEHKRQTLNAQLMEQATALRAVYRPGSTPPAPAQPALGDTVCGLPLTPDVSCQMREGHQIDHLALAVSRATPLSDTEREELEKFRWVQKHAVLIVASDPHVAEADRGTGACRQIVDALTHIGRGT